MKWFLVRYIYQIISGEGNHNVQFDEQLRLMTAMNCGDAISKAEGLADGFQPPFKNCKGEEVIWKFISVADVHEIPTPVDGIEITSILHEPRDVPAFLIEIDRRKTFLNDN